MDFHRQVELLALTERLFGVGMEALKQEPEAGMFAEVAFALAARFLEVVPGIASCGTHPLLDAGAQGVELDVASASGDGSFIEKREPEASVPEGATALMAEYSSANCPFKSCMNSEGLPMRLRIAATTSGRLQSGRACRPAAIALA